MTSSRPSRIISFGELLWDHFETGRRPGGAPLNFTYHLTKLGQAPKLLSRIGADEPGKSLLDQLRVMGIDTGSIQVDPRFPTGTVQVVRSGPQEWHFEIVDQVAWDHIALDRDLIPGKGDWLVYGSLASRHPDSAYTLERMLDGEGMAICDLNLRTPHFSRDRIFLLLERANLVKLNEGELTLVSGWCGWSGGHDLLMERLCRRFGWIGCLVTRGQRGSFLWEAGSWYEQPAIPVEVVDTVGCGDAFLAGFLAGRIEGFSIPEQLVLASRLGALVAGCVGACPDYDPSVLRGKPDFPFR